MPSAALPLQDLREALHILLSTDAVDFLGITEKLLTHRSTHPDALDWLRSLGFVHLFSASGIHLYLLAGWMEFAMRTFCLRFGLPVQTGLRITRVLQLLGWLWLWMLAEFRAGLLRPLLLVSLRIFGRQWGVRWRLFSPLILALVADTVAGAVESIVDPEANSSWSARIHYALAVGGGLAGYEWARERKAGVFVQHLSLAWASWLFTAVLQLALEQSVSPWTPLLSLITLSAITYVYYPLVIMTAFLYWLSPVETGWNFLLHRGLQWISVLWNHGIFALAKVVDQWGGWISVSGTQALSVFFLGIVATLLVSLRAPARAASTAADTKTGRGSSRPTLDLTEKLRPELRKRIRGGDDRRQPRKHLP